MEKLKFNAAMALMDFVPSYLEKKFNDLKEGHWYHFFTTGVQHRDSEGRLGEMIETDNGIHCDATWVARSPIDNPGIYLNMNMDSKFHCVQTPLTTEYSGIPVKCIFDYVSDEHPNFPQMRVRKMLPMAVPVEYLEIASDDIRRDYEDYFNMSFVEIIRNVTYLPTITREEDGIDTGRLKRHMVAVVEIAL